MTMEPLSSFFAVSVILLGIGIYGLTTKRNAIRILFSVELIYNAANLNIIAFARLRSPPIVTGQVLVLFTIALAAMEAAVGLAIIILVSRLNTEIDLSKLSKLKG
ncbi:MAG TPA: NADH-quinone oxidoreductase subunit NuoK [Candidatus Bathyarchaeia archaeon]|nr:NADH-quinone oxidoreductase subunit NuoK [Candidatus Bathyarchaeia archaeon]